MPHQHDHRDSPGPDDAPPASPDDQPALPPAAMPHATSATGGEHEESGIHDHTADEHGHEHESVSGHTHGRLTADRPEAMRVVVATTVLLAAVAAIELTAAAFASSAGVLADGLHNLGDVATTVALGGAFLLSRRAASRRFPYGYHRGEDLAGLLVLLLMIASAIGAGITAVEHLISPPHLSHLPLALGVALAGLVGNEIAAQYKISAGRRIGSSTLVADGRHSRVDGLASLGAAVGVGGAMLGWPVLDPIAGLVITVVIGIVAWDTGRNVSARLLDEVDASLVSAIQREAQAMPTINSVTETNARWVGRTVWAEVTIEVAPTLTVAAAHSIGEELRHRLHHRIESLANVTVHLDPAGDAEAHASTAHHGRAAHG